MKVIRVGRCLDCPYIQTYLTKVDRKIIVDCFCRLWKDKSNYGRKIKDTNAIPKFCKLEEIKENHERNPDFDYNVP